MALEIVSRGPQHAAWANALLHDSWASVRLVSRGVLHDASALPGFVALLDAEPAGLLTYSVRDSSLEVVTLNSTIEGRGVGLALLEAARKTAVEEGCRRVWLITTNDNQHAQRFYERRGFRRVAVHRDAILESRRLKPEIPLTGQNGIEIRDEIEYEWPLA